MAGEGEDDQTEIGGRELRQTDRILLLKFFALSSIYKALNGGIFRPTTHFSIPLSNQQKHNIYAAVRIRHVYM